jgi:hypothetical protein
MFKNRYKNISAPLNNESRDMVDDRDELRRFMALIISETEAIIVIIITIIIILMVIILMNVVSWDLTPCGFCKNPGFGGT